jgi:hypothetical protein
MNILEALSEINGQKNSLLPRIEEVLSGQPMMKRSKNAG